MRSLLLLSIALSLAAAEGPAPDDLGLDGLGAAAGAGGLDLAQELGDVNDIAGTLVATEQRYVPAAVTVINRDDIWRARARTIDELLDIYVPNLQVISHPWETDHLGFRGLLSDRDDKYLFLVNGRSMNQLTHRGAMAERDLVLQGDIHRIQVVRGPGSAIYGPGALAGVVEVTTETARTFQGQRVVLSGGAVERYLAGEVMLGTMLNRDTGLFLYAGVADYDGASPQDAPQWTGKQTVLGPPANTTIDGDGEGTQYTNRDGSMFRSNSQAKLFADLSLGRSDIWVRYSQGGKTMTPPIGLAEAIVSQGYDPSVLTEDENHGCGYRQTTVAADGRFQPGKDLRVLLHGSWQSTDFMRVARYVDAANGVYGTPNVLDAHREDQMLAKLDITGTPSPDHTLTVGAEFLRIQSGLQPRGWSAPDTAVSNMANPVDPWVYHRAGLVGEYQWIVSDLMTWNFSARADIHEHVKPMFSPRFGLVLTPTEADTVKVILARAQRCNFEKEIRNVQLAGGSEDATETLDTVETRAEHAFRDTGLIAFGAWYHSLEMIGYDQGLARSASIGTQTDVGAEFEAAYQSEQFDLRLSHGWVQLLNMELADSTTQQYSTTEPYGYGDDFSWWSNHVTKVSAAWTPRREYTLDASLRVQWGYPGAQADLAYNQDSPANAPNSADPGWNIENPTVLLNLGAGYDPTPKLRFRLNTYNILGLLDEQLNKRIIFDGKGSYRGAAPAMSVTASLDF